jgi:glycolate oxidase FAD binding subunit
VPRNELRSLNIPMGDELGRRAGSRPRVRPPDCAPYAIAGVVPKLVFSPRTLAEASKTIVTLAAEGAAILIRGAGTKQFRPPAPFDVDVVLDAGRCNGIVQHEPGDLTVTVSAGTTFAALQEALRPHGQFFPNDPAFATETTVGGMLASRTSGALRERYGTPRDNVLGMRVCLSDGSVAFSGAKVVKSVAGYDLPKLFAGSWGTLGFIGEVTLKVAPLPAEQRGVVASFPTCEAATAAAVQLAGSPLFPLATTLHDRGAAHRIRALGGESDRADWTLVVRCAGTRGAVSRQCDGVAKLAASSGASKVESLDMDRLLFAWADIAELAGGAAYPGMQYLCCTIVGLPTQVPAICAAVAHAFPDGQCTAHPYAGVVFAHVPLAPDQNLAPELPLRRGLHELLGRCDEARWSFTYLAAPPYLAAGLRSPVPKDAPIALMRKVKAALDPSGSFDPGRFLAGI